MSMPHMELLRQCCHSTPAACISGTHLRSARAARQHPARTGVQTGRRRLRHRAHAVRGCACSSSRAAQLACQAPQAHQALSPNSKSTSWWPVLRK